MAEIGGQLWQALLDIYAVTIPAQQRCHGQAVAKVVKARPMGIIGTAQTDLTGKLDESPTNGPFRQTCAALRKEEARADRIRAHPIAADHIDLQGVLRRRVEGHIPRLA